MSLESFLNKFNSPDGKYAYTIDPYKYFNATIKFDNGGNVNGGPSALQHGIESILNNVTAGIYSRVRNTSKSTISQNGHGSIQDVVNGSLIEDESNGALDVTYFAQSGTLPSITVPSDTVANTVVGDYTTHKMIVQPSTHEFSLDILNTKVSLLDRVFYPWMKEISYPYWSYQEQPYTTATVTISFIAHNDIAYVFLGSRPIGIDTIQPTNQLDTNMTRKVTFAFDFMYIASTGKNSEDIKDTIKNIGKTIVNTAAATIGL